MQRYKSSLAEENRQKILGQLEEAMNRLKRLQQEEKILKDINQKIFEERETVSGSQRERITEEETYTLQSPSY